MNTNTPEIIVDRAVLYLPQMKAIECIGIGNLRLRMLEAVLNYQYYGTEPDFDAWEDELIKSTDDLQTQYIYRSSINFCKGLWTGAEPTLRKSVQSYKWGKAGGRPSRKE